jgi:hypothetical protein
VKYSFEKSHEDKKRDEYGKEKLKRKTFDSKK